MILVHLKFVCLFTYFTRLFYSSVHFIIQPHTVVCFCYIRVFLMSWLHRNAKESSQLTTSAPPTPPAGDPGPLAARAPSPHGKRTAEAAQGPPKPPRLTTPAASPASSTSLLSKRSRAGEAKSPPALKVNIPTILVEDEPMEVDGEDDGRVNIRGCKSRPRPPVEGGSNGSSACPVFGSVRFLSSAPLIILYFLFSLRGFVGRQQ